jgi:phage replication O-like protein O
MAGRPQLEDGFTRIAHEILLNTARHKFNGTQRGIMDIVWRFTYGYRRKWAELSLTDLAEPIDATKGQVDRELKSLIARKVILVKSLPGQKRALGFNKNYGQWLSKDGKPIKRKGASLVEKVKYLDTVFLTKAEYDRLVEDFGKETVDLYIEKLDEWQTNYPRKARKDHNKTLRVWIKGDLAKRPKPSQQRKQDQMNILNDFYEEGRKNEANGDGSVLGSGKNGVPPL